MERFNEIQVALHHGRLSSGGHKTRVPRSDPRKRFPNQHYSPTAPRCTDLPSQEQRSLLAIGQYRYRGADTHSSPTMMGRLRHAWSSQLLQQAIREAARSASERAHGYFQRVPQASMLIHHDVPEPDECSLVECLREHISNHELGVNKKGS